jgi:hypothetical protein
MLRHSVRAFARRAVRLRQTEAELQAALEAPRVSRDFTKEWTDNLPNLDPPSRGADFLDAPAIEVNSFILFWI